MTSSDEIARLRFAVTAMRAALNDLIQWVHADEQTAIIRAIALGDEALKNQGADMSRTNLDGRDSLAGLDAYLTREEPQHGEPPVESDELELVYNDLRELTGRYEVALAEIVKLRAALREVEHTLSEVRLTVNNVLKG